MSINIHPETIRLVNINDLPMSSADKEDLCSWNSKRGGNESFIFGRRLVRKVPHFFTDELKAFLNQDDILVQF
jgi:hypothetical protein